MKKNTTLYETNLFVIPGVIQSLQHFSNRSILAMKGLKLLSNRNLFSVVSLPNNSV